MCAWPQHIVRLMMNESSLNESEGAHRGGEEGGDDELVLEGVLDLGHHARGAQVGGDEGGQQADDDAGAGDEQRVAHGGVEVILTQRGH